jgi:hypothetical protein
LSPSDQEKQADINKILAKMGEREKEFEYRVVPDVAFPKEGVPGYSELCERVEALYKSGYTDGWEANSLAYIRRHWNDPNKQHRKLP